MARLHDEFFARALRQASGFAEGDVPPLGERLAEIPRPDALHDLPAGTPVWVRVDLDVADRDGVIGADPRLASLHETLETGRRQGWRMLLLGHRGRSAGNTLEYVYQRLRETEAGCGPLIANWFDEHAETLTGVAIKGLESLKPGQFLVLENVRRYDFECRLWKATRGQIDAIADDFERIAYAFREAATVYVNDAISAGNKDFSTTALPLVMSRVALGHFARQELETHAAQAQEAELVIFSGLKLDKLFQLRRIVRRGCVKLIIAGGSLAMALRKAAGERKGQNVSIGAAGDPAQRDEKAHISSSAVEEALRLWAEADARGVRILLPVDFVLADGTVAEDIPPDAWQLDIGPRSRALFEAEALSWARGTQHRVAFLNGVMGQFENAAFAGGTRAMIGTLKQLQGAGVRVYVGGGEGRAALEKFASLGDVTHAFTAGGTILRCLAGEPLPFLEALAANTLAASA